jgi:sulfatase maturation enzyme AslB (radical SAM superfamily)
MTELKTIVSANRRIRTLLGPGRGGEGPLRWTSFLIRQPVEGGLLLHNTLTLELIFVPEALVPALEAPAGALRDWLRDRWYLIPPALDEHRAALDLRETLRAMEAPAAGLEKYTVFTTTACNARCFYCFEQGWKPRTMSPETADRVADYMLAHSPDMHFQIDWFGGEPLVNLRVIDRICRRLAEAGADFTSAMVTNGYLFDGEIIRRAGELWRLTQVHITLDGLRETYERIKAYKDGVPGAFDRVLGNIRALTAAGIRVNIRMNYGLHNLEEISRLTDYLIAEFAGTPGLTCYPIPLNEDPDDPAAQNSPAEHALLCQTERTLRDRLIGAGMFRVLPLRREPLLNMCMADSGRMITVLPEGQFGLCETYDRDGFIGSLDSPGLDEAGMAEMRRVRDEIPDCADCPIYPNCIRLRKCPNQICYRARRELREDRERASMLLEWRRWQKKQAEAAGKAEMPGGSREGRK